MSDGVRIINDWHKRTLEPFLGEVMSKSEDFDLTRLSQETMPSLGASIMNDWHKRTLEPFLGEVMSKSEDFDLTRLSQETMPSLGLSSERMIE